MRLFRIYVDGNLFYHPQLSSLAVTKAQVQEDAGSIDSLTLSAPFNHPYLADIKPMSSAIVCKRGDDTVFEGRALDNGTDFYNTHTWTCESVLAYLKDTIQPPYDYSGTLKGLLEYFISEHNKAVEDKKKLTVGNVTVTDDNDYVHYSSSDYSVTMDAIRQKLLGTHGGYLRLRYTENGKVLDYLADFSETSLQTVEFGKNLTDVKINTDHTERATALIPLGAKIRETDDEGNETETDGRIDIASVNGGKNYIFDEAAVKVIGWIWKTEIWEDVNLPSNLLRKASQRLSELTKGITSMELTIVDESDTGADIPDIHARQYVECKSAPHGIDGRYLVLSKTKDYLNPSGNTITIGASGVTLTSASVKQGQNISALEEDILGQESKISMAVKDASTALDATHSLKENIHECYSEISKTAEEINLSVREEYISRSELEAIQQDFESVKPTIGSLTAERIDGTVPSTWGIYVQSKSKAKLTVNGAAGSYGSTIASYSISGGGFAGAAASLTTGFLNSYGDITFTATVTDSRGRVSAAAKVTITVERYFVPYFETYTSQRCDSGGNLQDDGTYILGNALYNRAPCGNNNRVTRTIYYKRPSDTEWINAGVIFSSGDPIVFGRGQISTEYSYDIRYTITDQFNTVSVQDIVSTAAVVMDFKCGGKGLAIGKVSETDNCFEVSEDWDVKVYGKLLKDYISSIAGSVYPVGSIYMSVTNTNPSAYFGGTWVAWGSGRVPVGVNASDTNFSTVEKTGGASTVTLTTAQMPGHSHAKGTLSADSGGSHKHNLNLTKSGWGVDNASNKVIVDSTTYKLYPLSRTF